MTDINPDSAAALGGLHGSGPGKAGSCSREEQTLVAIVELLFFAYRDFTHEPDAVLSGFGFGRAHHRVLHFVNRRPGMRVADLLDILQITKQSLARVLKELVDRGFITQEAGAHDRRERRLYLTSKGSRLPSELTALQTARIREALAMAGPAADKVARTFLLGMVGPQHRAEIARMLEGEVPEGGEGTEVKR